MNRFPYQKFAVLCLCRDNRWHQGTEFLELSTTDRPKRTARQLAQRGYLFVKYQGSRHETIYRITDTGMELLTRLSQAAVARGIPAPERIKDNGRRLHQSVVKEAKQAAVQLKNKTLFEEWERL